MTTVQRPDAHIYDQNTLGKIREGFDIILSSEQLREDPTFWDPRVGLDDVAVGVGGALTTEMVVRMLEASEARQGQGEKGGKPGNKGSRRPVTNEEIARNPAVKAAQEAYERAKQNQINAQRLATRRTNELNRLKSWQGKSYNAVMTELNSRLSAAEGNLANAKGSGVKAAQTALAEVKAEIKVLEKFGSENFEERVRDNISRARQNFADAESKYTEACDEVNKTEKALSRAKNAAGRENSTSSRSGKGTNVGRSGKGTNVGRSGGSGKPSVVEVAREISSKYGKGLKVGGRMLGGAAVALFLYRCYEYATDDPQFKEFDENNQKILVDPRALSGDAKGKNDLFNEKNTNTVIFMALYAVEYGLAGVPQSDWANYLVNMNVKGNNSPVFTMNSEVKLRSTLIEAYKAMSEEEKIRFCDYLLEKHKDDPVYVKALQNLKANTQNGGNGNGNVRPADTRTSTSTPPQPGNVAPTPAVTPHQTGNVAPTPAVTPPQPGSGRRRMKIPPSSSLAPASRASVAPTADATRGLAGAQRITDEGVEVDLTRTGGNSRNA